MMFNQVGKELDVTSRVDSCSCCCWWFQCFFRYVKLIGLHFCMDHHLLSLGWCCKQKSFRESQREFVDIKVDAFHMTSKIRFSAIHLSPVCLPQREPQNPGVGEMRLMLNPSAGDQTRSASFGQNMSKPFQHDE